MASARGIPLVLAGLVGCVAPAPLAAPSWSGPFDSGETWWTKGQKDLKAERGVIRCHDGTADALAARVLSAPVGRSHYVDMVLYDHFPPCSMGSECGPIRFHDVSLNHQLLLKRLGRDLDCSQCQVVALRPGVRPWVRAAMRVFRINHYGHPEGPHNMVVAFPDPRQRWSFDDVEFEDPRPCVRRSEHTDWSKCQEYQLSDSCPAGRTPPCFVRVPPRPDGERFDGP